MVNKSSICYIVYLLSCHYKYIFMSQTVKWKLLTLYLKAQVFKIYNKIQDINVKTTHGYNVLQTPSTSFSLIKNSFLFKVVRIQRFCWTTLKHIIINVSNLWEDVQKRGQIEPLFVKISYFCHIPLQLAGSAL